MKGGTIYQENGKWVWKSPPWKEDGKTKRTRKSFNTKAEAEAQREKFLAQIHSGKNNYVIDLTVREAFKKWVVAEWETEEHITFNTQRNYVNIFNKHIFPFVGDLAIDKLNVLPFSMHLQEMADEGLSQKTINNTKQALVKLLGYATDIGWIDVNNSDKIKVPKAKKKPKERVVNTITEDEYKAVLSNMYSQYEPIIIFLKNTGLRAEELCIKDSDIQGKSLIVCRAIKRKNEGSDNIGSKLVVSEILKSSAAYRKVPLNYQALKAIKDFKEWKRERNIESEYIFCTNTGELVEKRNILRAFHSACEKAGVKKRGLHSLRKLFCKTLKDLPTEWEVVRAIMGHENISVTQRYYYSVDDDDIEDIARKLSGF